MATAEQILTLARKELGYRESPANSNRTKYGKWFKLDGNPWCMMFVMWIFHQAGASALLPMRTASCGDFVEAAKKAGNWRGNGDLRPGDIVIFNFPGNRSKTDHVGIVEEPADDGDVMTIEGNTSTGDDANGGAVMRRKRERALILGAFRPKYEAERVDETQEAPEEPETAWELRGGADSGTEMLSGGAETLSDGGGADSGTETLSGGAETLSDGGDAESERYRYSTDASPDDETALEVGDLLMFKGVSQFSSPYDDAEARPAAGCLARLDAYCPGAAYPFRLHGNGVDGWTAFEDAAPLAEVALTMDNVAYHEEADGLALGAGAFAVKITARSSLRVRGGPGVEFEELYNLPSGATVMAVGEENGWAKLSCGGWISRRYARKLWQRR